MKPDILKLKSPIVNALVDELHVEITVKSRFLILSRVRPYFTVWEKGVDMGQLTIPNELMIETNIESEAIAVLME